MALSHVSEQVLDCRSRKLDDEQLNALKRISKMVMRHMALLADQRALHTLAHMHRHVNAFASSTTTPQEDCRSASTQPQVSAESKSFRNSTGGDVFSVFTKACKYIQEAVDFDGVCFYDADGGILNEENDSKYRGLLAWVGKDEETDKPAERIDRAFVDEFMKSHTEGKVYDDFEFPEALQEFLPKGVISAIVGPVFDHDRNPFALTIAYSKDRKRAFTCIEQVFILVDFTCLT
jgi:hypothetical protein